MKMIEEFTHVYTVFDMNNLVVKLEFVLWHTKVQASARQTFADDLVN